MSAATILAVAASTLAYGMQSRSYGRLFQDLGRSLPELTRTVLHAEVILTLFGSIAATCVYVLLLARQRIRRGWGVGVWPGRVLFWMLVQTLILDALIAEAFHRPLVELIESLN